VTGGYAQARADLAAVEGLGISYDEVVNQLEDEGVSKFEAAWDDLLDAVATSLSSKGVEGE
jgi:transaldolase